MDQVVKAGTARLSDQKVRAGSSGINALKGDKGDKRRQR